MLPRLFRTVAFMGPVDVDLTRVRLGSGVSAPDAPLVRVQGLSLMSNVKVKVVDPNNPTSWLDRLRGRRADRP